MRCGTTGSCQSADTSEIVKRYWSRSGLVLLVVCINGNIIDKNKFMHH